MRRIVPMAVCACLFGGILSAQTPDRVDFALDVQPIFQQNCMGCHGPSQQMNGLSFLKRVSEDPKLLNARGPEGSTPFMYAVLYSNAATLEKIVDGDSSVCHGQGRTKE